PRRSSDLAAAPRGRAQAVDHAPAFAHARAIGRGAEDHDGERGVMLHITLSHYLIVAAILFTLGIFGIFLNRKNVIIILMSIELILLAVNINLVAFSVFLNDLVGQVFAMLVLTVAAAEAAIGLAIIVVYHRNLCSVAAVRGDMMKE